MILVGTDLSEASQAAVQSGAALARKHGEALILATVLEVGGAAERITAEAKLQEDAANARRDFAVSVECVVLEGVADLQLLEVAKTRAASLIVVGAGGSGVRGRRLGRVAENLCQLADVPIFVARAAERLVDWSRGGAALRVLVGSGLGDASKSALACVGSWADLELTVAHVAWPYGEHQRLGTAGAMPLDHLRPEVQEQLVADLGRWSSDVPCGSLPRLCVTPGWGRLDTHLALLAEEKSADLLVVGSHRRNLSERIWHGSISRNAIHEASCNVLCVPQQRLAHTAAAPRVIVVPTDFSALADRAIRVAYSLVPSGGLVHVVHVASKGLTPAELRPRLAARVPADASNRGVRTELEVLSGDAPWRAIWQYSGRVGADLVCMATHSRDAMASLLLGSQAQAILQHSRIPVLLVPPDRET